MLQGVKRDPLEKAYHVYRTKDGFTVLIGNVMATSKVLADTKAGRLFGRNVWTKEKQFA